MAKCGMKMPREVAISSPRSGWEAVVKCSRERSPAASNWQASVSNCINSPPDPVRQILRDAKRCKFTSDSDLFMPLQPFHHCFTTASRRWFFGSFTIVKSQILRRMLFPTALTTACRSLLSLTIASRDRICRSFTIVQALLYSLFL